MCVKSDCPFCKVHPENLIFHGNYVTAMWDAFPVSPGHALIIPKRHVSDWFSASHEEQSELWQTITKVKHEIELHHEPHGYNIGINCGVAAGQTVFHLHLHVIPRYDGDMDDPRGGVRKVIPNKARYWKGPHG